MAHCISINDALCTTRDIYYTEYIICSKYHMGGSHNTMYAKCDGSAL